MNSSLRFAVAVVVTLFNPLPYGVVAAELHEAATFGHCQADSVYVRELPFKKEEKFRETLGLNVTLSKGEGSALVIEPEVEASVGIVFTKATVSQFDQEAIRVNHKTKWHKTLLEVNFISGEGVFLQQDRKSSGWDNGKTRHTVRLYSCQFDSQALEQIRKNIPSKEE